MMHERDYDQDILHEDFMSSVPTQEVILVWTLKLHETDDIYLCTLKRDVVITLRYVVGETQPNYEHVQNFNFPVHIVSRFGHVCSHCSHVLSWFRNVAAKTWRYDWDVTNRTIIKTWLITWGKWKHITAKMRLVTLQTRFVWMSKTDHSLESGRGWQMQRWQTGKPTPLYPW